MVPALSHSADIYNFANKGFLLDEMKTITVTVTAVCVTPEQRQLIRQAHEDEDDYVFSRKDSQPIRGATYSLKEAALQ